MEIKGHFVCTDRWNVSDRFLLTLNIQMESPKLSSHKRNQLPNLNISFVLV